jgi:hypothetical protein
VRFVEQHRAVFGVEPVRRVVDLPASTFYDRRRRLPSARAVGDRALCARIEANWGPPGRPTGCPGCTPSWPATGCGWAAIGWSG